jgi:hypothetical protein
MKKQRATVVALGMKLERLALMLQTSLHKNSLRNGLIQI